MVARNSVAILVCSALLIGFPRLGSAGTILWRLSGTVTTNFGTAGASFLEAKGVTVGSPLEFTITLPDTPLPDFCPQDGEAFFFPGTPVSGSVNGQSYSGGTVAGIEVNALSAGCFGTPSPNSAVYVMRLFGLAAPFSNAILMWGASGIDPDIYPFAIPGGATVGLIYGPCGTCGFDMSARMGTVPVPEPATALLVGLSVVVFGPLQVRLRRRRGMERRSGPSGRAARD